MIAVYTTYNYMENTMKNNRQHIQILENLLRRRKQATDSNAARDVKILEAQLEEAKYEPTTAFTGMPRVKRKGRLALDIDFLRNTFDIVNDVLVCAKTGRDATWKGNSSTFVTIDNTIYQAHRIVYAINTGRDIIEYDIRKKDKDFFNYAFSNLEIDEIPHVKA